MTMLSYPDKIALRFAEIEEALCQQARAAEVDMDDYVHIPIDALATELGCRSASISGEPPEQLIHCPPQPDPRYEDLVSRSLVQALRITGSRYSEDENRDSLLDGLLRNNRWQLCLDTYDDAYLLAQTLVSLHHNINRYPSTSAFRESLASDVRCMLARWLEPHPVPTQTRASDTARLLFGSAWCDLRLDADGDHRTINKIIWTERPPFMPGLLAPHLETPAVPLMDINF